MRIVPVVFTLGCCLLSGCPSSGSSAASPPDAAPNDRVVKALTDADRARLKELGERFATALSAKDLDTVSSCWDLDGLWDRVVEGLSVSDAINRQAKAGFLSSMREANRTPLFELAGCTVSFRKINEDPKQGALLLFRAFQGDGSLVYVECLVDDPSATAPRFIDVYAYANGEFVSRTSRRLIAPGMAEASKTPLAKLLSGSKVDPAANDAVVAAMNLLRSGDAEGALAQLNALPEAVRRQKSVLILRRAAINLLYDPLQEPAPYEEQYHALLGELKASLSDDPRAQLMLIDYYLIGEEFEAYHQSLETLAEAVGDDAYLGFLHAVGYSRAGAHDEALAAAREALAQEPELDDVRLGTIDLLVAAERYEEAAAALTELEDSYGYTFDFGDLPLMRPFLESEAGRAWLARDRGE